MDARWHPDIARVQKLLQKRCETWRNAPIELRRQLATLFLPAATREDWLSAMEDSPPVKSLFDELAASSFWTEARSTPADDDGELFFELLAGSSYTLGERVA